MSEAGAPAKVSLGELAWTFNHIALASFGGGLSAWSREVIVVEKKWMGEKEFLSAMTMCRILPGANQVNMAVFTGTKMRAIPGAVAAIFGLCFMPLVIVLVLAFLYFTFKEVPAVKGRAARRVRGGGRADGCHGDQDRSEVPKRRGPGAVVRDGVRAQRRAPLAAARCAGNRGAARADLGLAPYA